MISIIILTLTRWGGCQSHLGRNELKAVQTIYISIKMKFGFLSEAVITFYF
jgi:hypothetical protein